MMPQIDRSWWAGHALANAGVSPSDTWCWFHGRHWLPQVAGAPAAVAAADAAHLLRLAALLVEATNRSGAARRWLSEADRLWARRTGMAMLGAAAQPPLTMHDAVGLFDAGEQGPLRLALPHVPHVTSVPPGNGTGAPATPTRLHRLLVLCRRYAGTPSPEDTP